MKSFFAVIFVGFLKVIYFFFKLNKTKKNKVVFISRQNNAPSLDMILLQNNLQTRSNEVECVFLCKKINRSIFGTIKYLFEIFKQMYHLSTARVCIIDCYIIPISVLKHKSDLFVIQLWHALATVKKFGLQSVGKVGGRDEKISRVMSMHKGYDIAISASKAMVKPFAEAFGMSDEKIVICSPPKISFVCNNSDKMKSDIIKKYPALNEKPNVLYAPTYRKNQDYFFDDLISKFNFDKYNLIIKSHPARTKKITDCRVFSCSEFSSFNLITISDYVITDYSAISVEAALLNKKVYIYAYDYDDYITSVGLNIDLYSELPGLVYKNIDPLLDSFENEYPFDILKKYKDKYVEDRSANSIYLLTDIILEKCSLLNKAENAINKVEINI